MLSDSLDALLEAVAAADSPPTLLTAVRHLAAARQAGAIPTLIAALSYNNPGAAVAAVEGLIQLGAAAVPPLLAQLEGPNYTARAWAMRALALIGDPRGLVPLLGVVTADFALSVRRAAAKGLGLLQWHWFPADLRARAQAEALEALLVVAQQDEEWVVRYAAVAGLQALAQAIAATQPAWLATIHAHWAQLAVQDPSAAVRARVWWAQQQGQGHTGLPIAAAGLPSPLSAADWQRLRAALDERPRPTRFGLAASDLRRDGDRATVRSPSPDSAPLRPAP